VEVIESQGEKGGPSASRGRQGLSRGLQQGQVGRQAREGISQLELRDVAQGANQAPCPPPPLIQDDCASRPHPTRRAIPVEAPHLEVEVR